MSVRLKCLPSFLPKIVQLLQIFRTKVIKYWRHFFLRSLPGDDSQQNYWAYKASPRSCIQSCSSIHLKILVDGSSEVGCTGYFSIFRDNPVYGVVGHVKHVAISIHIGHGSCPCGFAIRLWYCFCEMTVGGLELEKLWPCIRSRVTCCG